MAFDGSSLRNPSLHRTSSAISHLESLLTLINIHATNIRNLKQSWGFFTPLFKNSYAKKRINADQPPANQRFPMLHCHKDSRNRNHIIRDHNSLPTYIMSKPSALIHLHHPSAIIHHPYPRFFHHQSYGHTFSVPNESAKPEVHQIPSHPVMICIELLHYLIDYLSLYLSYQAETFLEAL